MKKRIINAEKYLNGFLRIDENFKVGLLYEDAIKSENFAKYGFPEYFSEGESIIPKAFGSATKYNVKGKFGRVEPEEKEDKKVHIKYINKKVPKLNLIEFFMSLKKN